jgi:hypothetical protein
MAMWVGSIRQYTSVKSFWGTSYEMDIITTLWPKLVKQIVAQRGKLEAWNPKIGN